MSLRKLSCRTQKLIVNNLLGLLCLSSTVIFGQNPTGSRSESASHIDFVQAGPLNLNGRARAFHIDRNNDEVFYLGIAGGGILKSENKGRTWSRIEGLNHLWISDFTQTPDGTLYAVTGSSFDDVGLETVSIYKSTNGSDFAYLSSFPRETEGVYARINFIHSLHDGSLMLGTNERLYYSNDDGENWTVKYPTDNCPHSPIRAQSIVTLPNGNTLFATSDQILHSTDPSIACNQNEVFNSPTSSSRIVLDYCKNNPDYVYAMVRFTGAFSNHVEIYKSTDGGLTWKLNHPTFQSSGIGINNFTFYMGFHSLALAVDPVNCDVVYAGSREIYKISDRWDKVASGEWNLPNGTKAFHTTFQLEFEPENRHQLYVAGENGLFSIDLQTVSNEITSLNSGGISSYVNNIAVDQYGRIIASTYTKGSLLIDPQKPSSAGRTATPLIDIEGFSHAVSNISGDILVSRHSNEVYLAHDGKQTVPFFPFPDQNNYEYTGQNGIYQTLFTYWESDSDSLSTDSVVFVLDTVLQNLHTLQAHTQKVTGTLNSPQPAAKLIPGTISFIHRNDNDTIIVRDYNQDGKLYNDFSQEIGFIDYQSKQYEINFTYSPKNNSLLQIKYPYTLGAGDSLFLKSTTRSFPINVQLTTNLSPGDSFMVQDPYSSVFALNFENGIVLSKEVLRQGVPSYPDDYIDLTLLSGMRRGRFYGLVFSHDGNHLFFSSNSGLYRISGIKNITSENSGFVELNQTLELTQIANVNLSKLQISPHNNNELMGISSSGNQVVQVRGILPGQTTTTHSIWNNSNSNSPLCASYDVQNEGRILAGTREGLYLTDDLDGTDTKWVLNGGETDFMFIEDIEQISHHQSSEMLYGNFYLATRGMGVLTNGRLGTYIADRDNSNIPANNYARQLLLYPNPAAEKVHIALRKAKHPVTGVLKVYDISGKLVHQSPHLEIGNQYAPGGLNISNFKPGIYIVRFLGEEIALTERLIISK